jgi:hypothetical protein
VRNKHHVSRQAVEEYRRERAEGGVK